MTYSAGKSNSLIRTRVDLVVSVTAETDALTVGTHANWLKVISWNQGRKSRQVEVPAARENFDSIKELTLELTCDATETITSPVLYGIRKLPVTIADDDVDTVDFANNELDLTSHSYLTGDGPVRISAATTLATGLSATTDYWVRVVNANTIQLHTSLVGAVEDSDQATFSDGGTGTHTIADVQSSANADDDTQRLHWCLYGDINEGNTITVGAQLGYVERIQHDPLTLWYEFAGSSGTGAQTLVMRVVPVQSVEW